MKYHVARDGQPIGIFLEYEVKDGLRKGELRATDLYWREGMAEWQPLSSAEDLADALDFVASQRGQNPYAPPVAPLMGRKGDGSPGEPVVLATLMQRLGAALIDFMTFIPFWTCYLSALQMMGPSLVPTTTSAALLMVGGLGMMALLIFNLVLLWTRGQTFGKKWMNIRIANFRDSGNPGPVKAILLRGFCNGIITMIPVVGLFYMVADIAFIFREDRRCLHDLLADTHVVQGVPPGM